VRGSQRVAASSVALALLAEGGASLQALAQLAQEAGEEEGGEEEA